VTPEAKVAQQLERARRGYRLARARDDVRATALTWLEAHPSGMPDVDACWAEALRSPGSTLAEFLERDLPPEAWAEQLPLRCIVSSHPFPDLWRWTVPL
jgi:hypothetical protein